MKKYGVFLLLMAVVLSLAYCIGRTDYSDYAAGRTFVYEKEGFYGDFTISIREDGTFTYYEGMLSSYIGIGEWTIRQNAITLVNEIPAMGGSRLTTNIFEIEKGKLIWRAEGSDNFTYVKVTDGETFLQQ